VLDSQRLLKISGAIAHASEVMPESAPITRPWSFCEHFVDLIAETAGQATLPSSRKPRTM